MSPREEVLTCHLCVCRDIEHLQSLESTQEASLQCRRILGGRNLVRVRNIVVAAIFDFMTVEDWGE